MDLVFCQLKPDYPLNSPVISQVKMQECEVAIKIQKIKRISWHFIKGCRYAKKYQCWLAL